MKAARFDYVRPNAIGGALEFATAHGSAKFLAGGQSLGPLLNLRLVQPDLLIDITAIKDLRRVEETADGLTIGSCITHADIEDGRVPDVTGGRLRDVAASIAYRAVRNRGTVGGSIAHADPAADWISALAAMGAEALIAGTQRERRTPVENLMTGVFESSLTRDELLTGVHIPRFSPSARWGYYKYCRKTGELAQAIGAYLYDPDRPVCRAVIGAAGGAPIVFRNSGTLFRGRVAGAANIDRAVVIEAMAAQGVTDYVEQKVHFVCLQRAIAQAHQQ